MLLVPLFDKTVVAAVVPEPEAVPVVEEAVTVYDPSTDFVMEATEVSMTDAVEEVTASETVDVPEAGAEVAFVPSVLVGPVFVDVVSMFVLVPVTSLRVGDVETEEMDTEADVDTVSTLVAVVPTDELDFSVCTDSLLLVIADVSTGAMLVDKAGDVSVPSTLRVETGSELEDVVAAEVLSVDVRIPEAVSVTTTDVYSSDELVPSTDLVDSNDFVS